MRWDLYCRVIDNHGDVGVCWRLAADLASRGESVRLVIDDPSALAWMAPQGAAGVQACRWQADTTLWPQADVVIEAFGCELPAATQAAMAARAAAPVWINLEYLSAEAYVERSHGLPSPQQSGPGASLVKWFFYPGFTPSTGGLLREPGLTDRRAAFDAVAWLGAQGFAPHHGERCVSLFCYENPALPALLERLAETPTLLLVTAGLAARQVRAQLGPTLRRGHLRTELLPYLPQADFDRLLWSCELNFVRGEDSWVRAQWAGRPFVWQAYPQSDAAHHAKVEAFLDRQLAAAPPALAQGVRDWHQAWNAGRPALPALPPLRDWQRLVTDWRAALLAQADLGSQLLGFVARKR